MEDEIHLKLRRHESRLSNYLDTIRESGKLFDCTLEAEGKTLQAHRVVLCAYSPYLERLFDKDPFQEVIYTKDVELTHLRALVNLMYKGEVTVPIEEFKGFKKVIKKLEMEDLAGYTAVDTESHARTQSGRSFMSGSQQIDDDESHSVPKHLDTDDDAADNSLSSCLSLQIWEVMYGPITAANKRGKRNKYKFPEGYEPNRQILPATKIFSQNLLDALHKDDTNPKLPKSRLFKDVALLHYFECNPNEIRLFKGEAVFKKISNLKWPILSKPQKDGQIAPMTGVSLCNRFKEYIRGYIDEFGLPQTIVDEFLYWESQKH